LTCGRDGGALLLPVPVAGTELVAERLQVREIDDDEGQRLGADRALGPAGNGDLAAAQTVLLSAQGIDVTAIARVAFTSEDRVHAEIRNFNPDGSFSLPEAPLPEIQGRPGAEVHPRPAAGDQ
jgi:hypothetical protein